MLRTRSFRTFAPRARRTIAAILLTFALVSAVSATLSIWATGRSKNRAGVVEVAARQRTLAERYVSETLLVRSGGTANPARTAALLAQSARALLDGGTAPAVDGDDDETTLAAATDPVVRAQLRQEQRLVADLTATGKAFLAGRPVSSVAPTANERIRVAAPTDRLRILAALLLAWALVAATRRQTAHFRSRPTGLPG